MTFFWLDFKQTMHLSINRSSDTEGDHRGIRAGNGGESKARNTK